MGTFAGLGGVDAKPEATRATPKPQASGGTFAGLGGIDANEPAAASPLSRLGTELGHIGHEIGSVFSAGAAGSEAAARARVGRPPMPVAPPAPTVTPPPAPKAPPGVPQDLLLATLSPKPHEGRREFESRYMDAFKADGPSTLDAQVAALAHAQKLWENANPPVGQRALNWANEKAVALGKGLGDYLWIAAHGGMLNPQAVPLPTTPKEQRAFLNRAGKAPPPGVPESESRRAAENYLKHLGAVRTVGGALTGTAAGALESMAEFGLGGAAAEATLPERLHAAIQTAVDLGFTGQQGWETGENLGKAVVAARQYGADSPQFAAAVTSASVNAAFGAMGIAHLGHASTAELRSLTSNDATAPAMAAVNSVAEERTGKEFAVLGPAERREVASAIEPDVLAPVGAVAAQTPTGEAVAAALASPPEAVAAPPREPKAQRAPVALLRRDPLELPERDREAANQAAGQFLAKLKGHDRQVVADWIGADGSRGFDRRARERFQEMARETADRSVLSLPKARGSDWRNAPMWRILREYAAAVTNAPESRQAAPGEAAALPKPPEAAPEAPSAPRTVGRVPGPVAAAPPKVELPPPGHVGQMPVSDIAVDPARFQFKLSATGPGGTSPLLRDVERFRPERAGTISVWTDPQDGKTYVVNGHHRLELAQRTGAKTINVYRIDEPTAARARAVGALQNIAEGRGTPIDAAKFLRDSGMSADDLRREDVPLREKTVQEAVTLAKLDQPLFDQVVSGQLRQGRAIAIAEGATTPQQQWDILKLVKDREAKTGHPVSDDALAEMIRLVKSSGTHTESQDTLFGPQEVSHSLAFEKGELSAAVRKQLGEERRAFGAVSSEERAKRLGKAGNKINAAENARIATEAAQALEVYDRLSGKAGPIADALEQGARRLAAGEPAAKVKAETYEAVRQAVAAEMRGRAPEAQTDALVSLLPDVARVTPVQKQAVGVIVRGIANYLGETPEETIQRIRTEAVESLPGKNGKVVKGEAVLLDGGRAIIRLAASDADLSTWVHELAHTFVPLLKPEDKEAVWKWLGAQPGEDLSVAQHETFARGFERYLANGVSPDAKLRSVFESFKRWMLDIYGQITAPGSPLRIKLSPAARRVYAKMVGAEPHTVPERVAQGPPAPAPEEWGSDAADLFGSQAEWTAAARGALQQTGTKFGPDPRLADAAAKARAEQDANGYRAGLKVVGVYESQGGAINGYDSRPHYHGALYESEEDPNGVLVWRLRKDIGKEGRAHAMMSALERSYYAAPREYRARPPVSFEDVDGQPLGFEHPASGPWGSAGEEPEMPALEAYKHAAFKLYGLMGRTLAQTGEKLPSDREILEKFPDFPKMAFRTYADVGEDYPAWSARMLKHYQASGAPVHELRQLLPVAWRDLHVRAEAPPIAEIKGPRGPSLFGEEPRELQPTASNVEPPEKPTWLSRAEEFGAALRRAHPTAPDYESAVAEDTYLPSAELPGPLPYTPEEDAVARAAFNGEPVAWVTGWRYGEIPAEGRSFNARDARFERGVSLAGVGGTSAGDPISRLFLSAGRTAVQVGGWTVGRGADGEPLVVGARRLHSPGDGSPAASGPGETKPVGDAQQRLFQAETARPSAFAAILNLGAGTYLDGRRDFADWSRKMAELVGHEVEPLLEPLFQQSKVRLRERLSEALTRMPKTDPRYARYAALRNELVDLGGSRNATLAPIPPPVTSGPPAVPATVESGSAHNGPGREAPGAPGLRHGGPGDEVAGLGRAASPAGSSGTPAGAAQPGGQERPGGVRADRGGAGQPPERAGQPNRRSAIAASAADATVETPKSVKARPVRIEEAERDWGIPLYDAGNWPEVLRAAAMPEGTPIPSVSFRPDIRDRLIGEQPIVGEVALSAIRQRGGALIATPTGSGKAHMLSAITAELQPKRALVLTAGKTLPQDLMGVMRTFGLEPQELPRGSAPIPASGLFVTNYEALYDPMAKRFRTHLADEHWDLVVADESDKARNWHAKDNNRTGRLVRDLTGRADRALYLSASPFHTALDAGYLEKLGLWKREGFMNWAKQFGVRVRRDGSLWAPPNPKAVDALRARMIEAGVMATSDLDMRGHGVQFGIVPLTAEQERGLHGVVDGFGTVEAYYSAEGQMGKARVMRAQVATYLKSYLERARLEQAVEVARRAVNSGYQVVIHSGTFGDRTPDEYKLLHTVWEDKRTGLPAGDPTVGDSARRMIPPLPSITQRLAKEFGQQFVDFSGGGSEAKRDELARWNRGDARVMFASYAMGGRGVGMHDTSVGGVRPRLAIHLGLPYDGFTLMQALGRPWRKRTTSDVVSAFLLSDTEPEVRLVAGKIGPRLASLRAAVSGMRVDDPVLKAFREIAKGSTAGYEFGDDLQPQAEQFKRKVKTSGVQGIDDLMRSIPPAAEMMGKGIGWQGREGGERRLQQMLDDSRQSRAKQLRTGQEPQPAPEASPTDRDSMPVAPPAPPSHGGPPVPPPGDTAPPPAPSPNAYRRMQRAYGSAAKSFSHNIGLGVPYEAIERAGFKPVADAFYQLRIATMGHAARQLAERYASDLNEFAEKLWPGADPVANAARDKGKLAAMAMYDTQTREELRREEPELFAQLNSDPKVQQMVDHIDWTGVDQEMTRMRRYLGGTLLAGRHIRRAYVRELPEDVGLHLKLERGELDPWDRDVIERGSQPLPVRAPNYSRYASAKYYLENGDPDFGHAIVPTFEATEKMYRKRLAWDAMANASTRVTEAPPRELQINGRTYYRQQAADEIAHARARGRKDLPEETPVYRIVSLKESMEAQSRAYERLHREVMAGTSDQRLRGLIESGHRALAERLAVPEEIARAWTKFDTEDRASRVSSTAIGRLAQGLTDIARNQIYFFGFGVRHAYNIARRLTELQDGGVASPVAWAKTAHALFGDPELRQRSKLQGVGPEGEQFRALMRNGGIVGDRLAAFVDYADANSTWAKVAQFGHKWLFGRGGLDTKARLWMDEYLRARRPDLDDRQRADAINAAFGRASRATRTDLQNSLSLFMMFPGWDIGTLNWVIQHPVKTAIAPAAVTLLANMAVQYATNQQRPGRTQLTAIDANGREYEPALLSEWVARRFAYPFLQAGNAAVAAYEGGAGATGADQAFAHSLFPSSEFGNAPALAEEMLAPYVLIPLLWAGNHAYPGQQEAAVYPSDKRRKPILLPVGSRAAEKEILIAMAQLMPLGSSLLQSMIKQRGVGAIGRDLKSEAYSALGLGFGLSNYQASRPRR